MKAYDFKVLLEPDETGGYVATCPSLPPRDTQPSRCHFIATKEGAKPPRRG